MRVVVHADDLGICRSITDRIIETHREGCVRRTSIVANGEAFQYAVERLQEFPELAWSVHLNLVEGRCLGPKQELSLLVDKRGWFKQSFIRLLLLYLFVPWCRARLRRQVRTELNAQIERVRGALKSLHIRVDSHRYVHLLPFVFAVVMERSSAWRVREIRIVDEPLFTRTAGLRGLGGLISANLLKAVVLRILSKLCRRQLRCRSIGSPERFLGVLFSGRMSARVVCRGLRKIARRPSALDGEVEVLFHPGPADPRDRSVWKENPRQSQFYFSSGRAVETEALLSQELRSYIESEDL
jgi:predicted glycoside hydrolase/deacetylase ChbG (UPF0249 family)